MRNSSHRNRPHSGTGGAAARRRRRRWCVAIAAVVVSCAAAAVYVDLAAALFRPQRGIVLGRSRNEEQNEHSAAQGPASLGAGAAPQSAVDDPGDSLHEGVGSSPAGRFSEGSDSSGKESLILHQLQSVNEQEPPPSPSGGQAGGSPHVAPVASAGPNGEWRCWSDGDAAHPPRFQAFCVVDRLCARRSASVAATGVEWELLYPEEWNMPEWHLPRLVGGGQGFRAVPAAEIASWDDDEHDRVFALSWWTTPHFSSWNDGPMFALFWQVHAAQLGLPQIDVFFDRSYGSSSEGSQAWKNGVRRVLVAHGGVAIGEPRDKTCFTAVLDSWGPLEPESWLPFGAPSRPIRELAMRFGPGKRRAAMDPLDGLILYDVMISHLAALDELRFFKPGDVLSDTAAAVAEAWSQVAQSAVGSGRLGQRGRDRAAFFQGGAAMGQDWEVPYPVGHKLPGPTVGGHSDHGSVTERAKLREDLWTPDLDSIVSTAKNSEVNGSGALIERPNLRDTGFALLVASAIATSAAPVLLRTNAVRIVLVERPKRNGRAFVDPSGVIQCAEAAANSVGVAVDGLSQSVSFEPPTPFEDQVAMVQDADVLITAHGAGSVNNQWLPPCGIHLELFPFNHFSPNFHGMSAEAMGLIYAYLHVRPDDEAIQSCIPESLRGPQHSYDCLWQDPFGFDCRLCVRAPGVRNVGAPCSAVRRVLARALVRRRQCLRELNRGLPPGSLRGQMFLSSSDTTLDWLLNHEVWDEAAFDRAEQAAVARGREARAAGLPVHDGEGLYYPVPKRVPMPDASEKAKELIALIQSPLAETADADFFSR